MVPVSEIVTMQQRIAPYINKTALQHFPALDEVAGNGIRIYIKPEILQPTKSFKVRNAFAAISSLPDDEKHKGVIAASTGNLGQALALAGQMLKVPVTICVKRNNNPKKNAAIRNYGAELIEDGHNYDEAYQKAIDLSRERGIPYIRSSENKSAFSGAATVGLEILNEGIKLDRLVVAVGSGAHAAGAGLLAHAMSPGTRVTGIQAVNSCTIHDHWHDKADISPEVETIADAISMGSGHFSSSVDLLRDNIDEFITATEDQIKSAISTIYKTTGHIVEPAGAVGVAAILANAAAWQNETITVVFSGGNLNDNLRYLLD
jgi:threonine dehydratase